jgi:hypothetical protein
LPLKEDRSLQFDIEFGQDNLDDDNEMNGGNGKTKVISPRSNEGKNSSPSKMSSFWEGKFNKNDGDGLVKKKSSTKLFARSSESPQNTECNIPNIPLTKSESRRVMDSPSKRLGNLFKGKS